MGGLVLLDELMANAWRPATEETYGGWRYRWADGMTRRANSAAAIGAGGNVGQLVDRAEAFYSERGAPMLIQASTASAPSELATHLQARGYRPTARTQVETAAAAEVVDRTRATLEVEITDTPTEQWLRTYWSVEATRGRSDDDLAVCRSFLLDPGLPTAFAAARRGADVIGVGQLVVERGWGGVQCMATDPKHRRQGVAGAVLNALAREAVRRRAEHMYLAVMVENDAAAALYERTGFRTSHEYSYWANRGPWSGTG